MDLSSTAAPGVAHPVPTLYAGLLPSWQAAQLNDTYGKGFAILRQQGWQVGRGMGRSERGTATPISQQVSAHMRAGIGFVRTGMEFSAAAISISHLDDFIAPAPLFAGATRMVPAADDAHADGVHSPLAHQAPQPAASRTSDATEAIEQLVVGVHGHADIWQDEAVLELLRTGQRPQNCSSRELDRVTKRARSYIWQNGTLHRRLMDGTMRKCPRPEVRAGIIRKHHESSGHFGAKRTGQLLATAWWWHGMFADAAHHVRQCKTCAQVKATFGGPVDRELLQTLPIGGLHYRWSADLGELSRTHRGNKYIMVCVEHFSGFMVLVPLASKDSDTVAFAFENIVLGQFGAPAEILTDQGNEFKGAFDDTLDRWLIDHRLSSPEHPQSDVKTERAVKTIKLACKSMAQDAQDVDGWDDHLPSIALGYNSSLQCATKSSPYWLMYAKLPVLPPGTRERLEVPLDASWVSLWPSDPSEQERVVKDLHERASQLKEATTIAGQNLLISQHRDRKYYKDSRSGQFKPRLRRFEIGDFVFVKYSDAQLKDSMRPSARPVILKIQAVSQAGQLTLIGSDGQSKVVPPEYCARCPLVNIDTRVHESLGQVADDTTCTKCASADRGHEMLLCDNCNQAWHMDCLEPALPAIPHGDWFCPECEHLGKEHGELERPTVQVRQAQQGSTDAEERYHREALELEGSPARINKRDGKVEYMGLTFKPNSFRVRFSDNTTVRLNLTKLRVAMRGAHRQLGGGAPQPPAERHVHWPDEPAAPASIPPVQRSACDRCLKSKKGPTYCAKMKHQQGAAAVTSVTVHASLLDAHTWAEWYEPTTDGERHEVDAMRVQTLQAVGDDNDFRLEGRYPPGEVSDAELQKLADMVEMHAVSGIIDPFSELGRIRHFARAKLQLDIAGPGLLTSPAAGAFRPLDPLWYEHVRSHGPLGAVWTVPWARLLDWLVPLWVVGQSIPMVYCLVPGDYFSQAKAVTLSLIQRLARQGRVLVVANLPWSIHNDRRQWLVITDSAQRLQSALKQPLCGNSIFAC